MKKQFTGFMAMMLSLMVVMTSLPLMSVQAVETNGSEEAVAAEGEAVETVSGNCGENAFYTLDSEGNMVISGEGTIEIDEEVVSKEDIKSVFINSGITGIGDYAFNRCVNLESVTIPESVEIIEINAFSNCNSLKSIIIPEGVKTIDADAFNGCSSLASITISSTVTEIGQDAFYETLWEEQELEKDPFLVVNGILIKISDSYKYEKEELIIPDSVIKINDYSCMCCGDGNGYSPSYTVKISSGVTYIGKEAFMTSALKGLEIPISVKKIDESAFDWTYITDIYYAGSKEQWEEIYSGEHCYNLIPKIHYNSKLPAPHTHTLSDWTVTKAATEDAVGTKVKKCTGCGEVLETAEIAKLPCSHKTSKWVVTTEATAKKAGLKEKKCSKCGKVLDSEKLPKFKVTLNATKVSLQQGKSTTAIKATVMKGDKVKSWKSSDAKVATVNSKGKITAKKAGTATITVTTKKGAKATVKVTVQNKAVKCTKLKVDKKKLTLKAKKSYQLNVTKTPVTTLEKVTYTSSNKKVATVNSKGKITARKAGTATITVKCGKKTVKVQVTVKKK